MFGRTSVVTAAVGGIVWSTTEGLCGYAPNGQNKIGQFFVFCGIKRRFVQRLDERRDMYFFCSFDPGLQEIGYIIDRDNANPWSGCPMVAATHRQILNMDQELLRKLRSLDFKAL